MEIRIEKNKLNVELFKTIRETASFKNYDDADIQTAIEHSLYSVVAYDGIKPVGIARVVGDNRLAFFIKDVVTIPEYQHQGVGHLMMLSIFDYLDDHAAPFAYVGLMSTPGKEHFYKKYGFIERPSEGFGSGMVMFYEPRK
jgi:GNAT superfamily N-acetyltransferase